MNVSNISDGYLKEVSCRVTNAVLKYLESQGYNSDSILNGLPPLYSKEYLSNPLNWVTYEVREIIYRRAAELTKDDTIMYKVGLSTPIINALGGIESIIRGLTGPTMVYRLVPKYSRLFDRVFRFKTTITSKNTATVEMITEQPAYQPSKDSCYFTQGILAAIPTLWTLPPAEVREKTCMYEPAPGMAKEGIEYKAEKCVYEVRWQPLSSWYQRFRDNVLGKVIPVTTDFKELEQSLRHVDQKNTELIARNQQLAVVREIATSVDKVQTIDEALSLAVEQAREIDGIRFVLVQTLDETGEYITTPYYSKKRHQNALDAIKAIGYDPEKELGKNPTSNKLRFKVSKIKIAQDYIKNPRVMILPSLAELLDCALPHTVCDAIQTILRVKKLVMVPLLVENKLWGNILYFLTQDIPTDILEMISTHCALALNNIINVNSLVSRNTELAASNKFLAAVREIAISVDRVGTIDEALTLVVEQSREIEGVRFVLVQKLDESREFVTTPYFSKIRTESKLLVDAVKALGFDPEKELGKNPTSNKLRFPFSKLKVAQDYTRNPRVMVMPSLAELLDGIWPRTLCDAIQKVLKVQKLVIVPLMVEGESWGNLLYFLTQDVPVDILEMIGAHCALAIKNIISLNNLELKNKELSVLNRVANITSKSLDTNTLLDDIVKEIIRIFTANATSVYISGSPGKPLKLAAHYGMPEMMVKLFNTISLDDVPMGVFFSSSDNTMSGAMDDFAQDYPQFKQYGVANSPSNYMTSILSSGSVRYGLVTVVRSGARRFNEDEQSLLLSIANQLAVSLENSRLHADVLKRVNEAEIARKSLEESIEKQKTIEEQLRESEERYRTIFESANDILILIDNKNKIVDVNARVEDIGGYDRKEIIGQDFRLLSKILTKKSVAILVKNYLKRLAGINVPFYDVEMITQKGEHRIIQINAVAMRKEGKIIGDLAILRDITELKQAEKNLKTQKVLIDRILATIPNAVLLLDKNLKVTMANQSFYSLFKLKKHKVEKKSINDFIVIADLQQAIIKAINGKEEKASTEIRYSIDSSEKILFINIFAMKEENLLLVINDVTEEREKQERLYLTDRLASVGEMASGVAHELNNPLTSIIGLSGIIASQDIPPGVKEDLNAINSEAQRCAAIVKNLLTFARKHTLKKEPVKIENIVGDVLKLRAYEHQANNITVETSFPPEFPKVLADYFQMQQVFLNIILNAEAAMIDAHGRGKLKITGVSNNEHISISFSDDGPGILKENLGLIFNPFFTTKEVGKGTGLGLSICYGIVTSHGGKVYARSDYGKGATFVVELPTLDH